MSLKSSLTQAFPPKPRFTESQVPDLSGKVYIVTGSNTGVGKELARMLYSKNGRVYMLARSADKTNKAIADIKKAVPASKGAMTFLRLDLADLSSIKATVERFLAMEGQLHVFFNNAGIMSSEKKLTTTPQGYEQHVGINVLGGFLLARLLTPILVGTAKTAPPNIVRVVWLASSAAEMFGEKNIGATGDMMQTEVLAKKSGNERYWFSKVGNWSHGVEYALRHKADGVISVPVNPGNLQSALYRDQGIGMRIVTKLIMYPPVNGAYTELYAGLSPDITIQKTGCWVVPFGRAIKSEAEGGTGGTRKFWEWTEDQVRPYL
ncbi:uncharacterized protein BCR38DRAFT_467283 [Pseudomassariella vexata]|uniref:Short-chain dehydrogenase n=1 Tax=Pseudomassariella vexata TaxID=1141098 RepID=A0A1Y2DPP6_9PEZI|nr:uncharacterized protein BCR38DRAFT_467283 [Pseudomassariella vexata]ORY61261.1 hypothetical protein BCR38DRAFT_467283 [Pseudomassariella vexata]